MNGSIKAHIRRLRESRILDYFKTYKVSYDVEINKPEHERDIHEWNVLKPELKQCILDMILLLDTKFTNEEFQVGVKKSFVDTHRLLS